MQDYEKVFGFHVPSPLQKGGEMENTDGVRGNLEKIMQKAKFVGDKSSSIILYRLSRRQMFFHRCHCLSLFLLDLFDVNSKSPGCFWIIIDLEISAKRCLPKCTFQFFIFLNVPHAGRVEKKRTRCKKFTIVSWKHSSR